MDNSAVGFEHVNFLNAVDRLDIELLKGALELLVVRSGGLCDLLDLPPGGALSADTDGRLKLCQLFGVHFDDLVGGVWKIDDKEVSQVQGDLCHAL